MAAPSHTPEYQRQYRLRNKDKPHVKSRTAEYQRRYQQIYRANLTALPELTDEDIQGFRDTYTPHVIHKAPKKEHRTRHVMTGPVFRLAWFSGDPARNRRTRP